MGIEICGKLDDFLDKLKAKGLMVSSHDKTSAVLSGKFAGFDASMYVFTTPRSNMVQSVSVNFNNPTVTWTNLKFQYMTIKELLSEKYGDPVEMEYFSKSNIDGSGHELEDLKSGKGCYKSTFLPPGLLDEGMIVLSINAEFSFPCVGLIYVDSQNSKLYMSESKDDL